MFTYKTSGVCSREIHFDIVDGKLHNVSFDGGCPGNLVEVMTCQGGCVGGAGQPYGLKKRKEKRGDGLHLSDNAAMFKRAERNPIVVRMMAEYGEERCHELLHVSYRGE